MNIRIRHIAHRRKGLVVQSEKVLGKQVLSVGRATDQDIYLSNIGVAYKHARVSLNSNGQIAVSSLVSAGLMANGRLLQSVSFKSTADFNIGPFNIVIRHQHDGYDFDVTIEQVAEDVVEAQSENLPAMTLEETWLSKRRAAWVFFILIIGVFLAFPLAGYLDKNLARQQRSHAYLPDDSSWSTGEISRSHQHFAKQCDRCHQQAFEQVPDKACVQCHAETTVHADPEFFDLHALQGVRCESCHKEHNGDDYLIRRDEALCADCHDRLKSQVETELEDIADFSTRHPEFKASVFVGGEQQRIALDSRFLKQDAGLIFPHDVHLDENGLDSPTGNRVLQCQTCHQRDASGRYMLPIEFERDCESCHRLTFDENAPERVLPHSNLEAMSATLDEYYAYVALKGNYQDDDVETPLIVRQRRIPGKELTPLERRTALAWAEEKAADVKEEMIELRACGYCHQIERDRNAATGWRIPAVHISQRWFSKGAFDHFSHRSTDCQDCHRARQSKDSGDVLMPGIEDCRECHGGEHAEGKLESTCITCHVFHTPDAMLLGDRKP